MLSTFQKQEKYKREGVPFARLQQTKSTRQIRINADGRRIISCKYKDCYNCNVLFSVEEKKLRINPCKNGDYSMLFEHTGGIRICVHSLFNHYDFMDFERHPIEFNDDCFDIVF